MIKSLDSYLISKAQWFCDKAHDLMGLKKFTLQKLAFTLSGVFLWAFPIIYVAQNYVQGQMLILTVVLVFAMLQIVSCITYCWSIDKEEIEFLRSGRLTHNGFHSTPLRLSVVIFNGVSILYDNLTLMPSYGILLSLFHLSMVASVYFCVCLPRPPGKNKAREFYEKGLWWLSNKLEGKPAPVSVSG